MDFSTLHRLQHDLVLKVNSDKDSGCTSPPRYSPPPASDQRFPVQTLAIPDSLAGSVARRCGSITQRDSVRPTRERCEPFHPSPGNIQARWHLIWTSQECRHPPSTGPQHTLQPFSMSTCSQPSTGIQARTTGSPQRHPRKSSSLTLIPGPFATSGSRSSPQTPAPFSTKPIEPQRN
jgi:hypothetical protein